MKDFEIRVYTYFSTFQPFFYNLRKLIVILSSFNVTPPSLESLTYQQSYNTVTWAVLKRALGNPDDRACDWKGRGETGRRETRDNEARTKSRLSVRDLSPPG